MLAGKSFALLLMRECESAAFEPGVSLSWVLQRSVTFSSLAYG